MKQFFILCLITCFSFTSQAQMVYLKAVLEGSQEVPATGSAATGVAILKYDMATRHAELMGDYQNLSSAAVMSHIHSPAPVGTNAPVLVPLDNTGGTTGTVSGTTTFTPAQETDLLAGNMYVNIHTTNFGGGEIRGQLTAATSGQTFFMSGRLQSAQQVPPNGSAALGSVTALLDTATHMVYLTGSYSGLTAAAGASHIHRGAANTNGAIFVNLNFSPAAAGTLHLAAAISPEDQMIMMNGSTYVNIHNSTYPGGEIRAQLIRASQMVFLKTTLSGSNEVPPTPSAAKGTVIVKYNTATRFLELTGDYQNLTAAATASHIHSPALPGSNAPVLIPLDNTGGTSGTVSGTATLTPAQEADLLGGLMYVNVHNSNYSGGEIRGQLSAATAGETQYLTGLLSGPQEVPATSSSATGSATVLLDKVTNEVYLTGNFSGLTGGNATMAHIHRGAAGTNGEVIVPLSPTASTSGTITGSAVVSATFADSMMRGFTYVNIHNLQFPGGEIRGQLGNLVLPVKLTYFNGYKQNNKIVLVWESAQEQNLSHYEIEQQSAEPNSWIKKATISAKGGNAAAKFSVSDQPVLNKNRYVIYRLKMVDRDGKFSYSPVIRINFEKSKAELSVITNPVVNGQLKYIVTGLSTDKKAEVTIVDFSGRVLVKTTASVFASNSINVSALPAGVYKLIVRAGESILLQSFTK